MDKEEIEGNQLELDLDKDDNAKEHQLEDEREMLSSMRESRRRAGSVLNDGDMLIKMFNKNEKGFVKNKEMKINQKSQIFGLNAVPAANGGGPFSKAGEHGGETVSNINKGQAYDVLFGEQMVRIVKNIGCQHNFNIAFLKNTTNATYKNQEYAKAIKTFQTMLLGNLVITNYRVLFVINTQKDKYFEKMIQGQAGFVHEFFNVPIGMISKIDKFLNLALDNKNQNKYNYNNN